MKKIIAIFFVVAIAGALFACGRNKDKNTTSMTTPTTSTQAVTTTRSEITTTGTTSTTGTTNPHPTETSGTKGLITDEMGTLPGTSTTPPTGTAPGGSTSVR